MANEVKLHEKLTGKILQAFNDNVPGDERIDVMLQPLPGQALVVTDKRVIIIKSGFGSTGGAFGASLKSFQFEHITSVDLRVSLLGGHIQITVPGSRELSSTESIQMAQSENALTFSTPHKAVMPVVASMIRERINTSRIVSGQQDTEPVLQPNIGDELQRLVDMVQQGFLTRDEFEIAKKKILEP